MAYVAPAYNNIPIGEIVVAGQYAIVIYNNHMITISSDLIGTGLVPIVFNQVTKKIHPRVDGETDIPVIMKDNKLVTLSDNETLII